jgi:glyoxylase-like metal-dependent hydrolase (beta-lactamase superfamily II)
MGGLALLRKRCPGLTFCASAAVRQALTDSQFVTQLFQEDKALSANFDSSGTSGLKSVDEFASLLRVDRVLNEADLVRLDSSVSLRIISTPGHTPYSLAYYVLPSRYLIVDETFGYFRGRKLSAPGGDHNIVQSIESIDRLRDLELTGLCCPIGGTITGALVRRHLLSVRQNTSDMLLECAKAFSESTSPEEIRMSIQEHFYSLEQPDPLLQHALERSCAAIWKQVQAFGATAPVLPQLLTSGASRSIDPIEEEPPVNPS